MASSLYIGDRSESIFDNLKTSYTPCYIILKEENPRDFVLAVTKGKKYTALKNELKTSDFKSTKIWLHIEGRAKKTGSGKKVDFEYYRTEKSSILEENRVLRSYIAKTVFGSPGNASFEVIEDEPCPPQASFSMEETDPSTLSKKRLKLQKHLESKLTFFDEKLSKISQALLEFMNAFYDTLPKTILDEATTEMNRLIYGKLEEIFDNKDIHEAINEILKAKTNDEFDHAQAKLKPAVSAAKKAYKGSILTKLDKKNPILNGMKVKKNGDKIITFWSTLV